MSHVAMPKPYRGSPEVCRPFEETGVHERRALVELRAIEAKRCSERRDSGARRRRHQGAVPE
jgi:hypothetical protein